MRKSWSRVVVVLLGVACVGAAGTFADGFGFAKNTIDLDDSVQIPTPIDVPVPGSPGNTSDNGEADFPPPPLGPVIAFLELDEFQAGTLISLIQQREQVVTPIAQEIAVLQQQLEQVLQSSNPEPPVIGVLILQIQGRKAAIVSAQAEFRVLVENQLSEHQRQKLHVARSAKALQPVLPSLNAIGLI